MPHAFSFCLWTKGFLKVMKNYTSNLYLILFVVSALLLMGCAKSETTTNRDVTATSSPAASPASTTAPSTASATEIGVAECDAFLKAYEACIKDKVPAAARPTFDTALTNWRKAWRDLANNPQTKGTLAAACKTARDQNAASLKAYGCTL